jgi:hypothetical protein
VIGYILSGQNHLYVKMLFNWDSAIQKCFRRFCTVCKSEILVPCQPSGQCVIPSGRSSVHSSQPSGRRVTPSRRPLDQSIIRLDDVVFRLDPSLYREASVPACIRPDDSVARPSVSQCSIKNRIFFTKANMGRLLQPSGRRGFPSRRATP